MSTVNTDWIDYLCVNTVCFLAVDMVQEAHSGPQDCHSAWIANVVEATDWSNPPVDTQGSRDVASSALTRQY